MADNVMRKAKAKPSPITRTAGEGTPKAPRVKPVRITVDLDPALHKQLKLFAVEADTDASSIIRALIAQITTDPTLAASVTSQLGQ